MTPALAGATGIERAGDPARNWPPVLPHAANGWNLRRCGWSISHVHRC